MTPPPTTAAPTTPPPTTGRPTPRPTTGAPTMPATITQPGGGGGGGGVIPVITAPPLPGVTPSGPQTGGPGQLPPGQLPVPVPVPATTWAPGVTQAPMDELCGPDPFTVVSFRRIGNHISIEIECVVSTTNSAAPI